MPGDTIIERKTYPAGASIFVQGDMGACAYVVQEGMVEIFITPEDGSGERVLGTITKGGIFGEMALIDKSPRMANARAKAGSTVIVITESMFNHKLEKADPFIRGLLGILADTIRRQNK